MARLNTSMVQSEMGYFTSLRESVNMLLLSPAPVSPRRAADCPSGKLAVEFLDGLNGRPPVPKDTADGLS